MAERATLLRRAEAGAAHVVVVPPNVGRLEANAPFVLTAAGEATRSAAVSGRPGVVVLPVSGVERAVVVTAPRAPARGFCLYAVPFHGGAAVARAPATWLGWAASWLGGAAPDAHGEFPPTPAERELMRAPLAVVSGAATSTTVAVPFAARVAGARVPFAVETAVGATLRSRETAGAERWFVVELPNSDAPHQRLRFTIDGHDAVICVRD